MVMKSLFDRLTAGQPCSSGDYELIITLLLANDFGTWHEVSVWPCSLLTRFQFCCQGCCSQPTSVGCCGFSTTTWGGAQHRCHELSRVASTGTSKRHQDFQSPLWLLSHISANRFDSRDFPVGRDLWHAHLHSNGHQPCVAWTMLGGKLRSFM